MKILIIEDEMSISQNLKNALEKEGFAADIADDGEQGLFLALHNDYDLILLDYMLPKFDGKEVCIRVRKAKDTPIIMLTVRSEIDDKVDLLYLGADDYIAKPFSMDELIARIKTIMRRPSQLEAKIIKIGNLAINTTAREITIKGQRVALTKKEFDLLEYLAKNKNRALSRGLILENVWDINTDPFSNTIETHILNIRKKIFDKNSILIETIPGIGYKING